MYDIIWRILAKPLTAVANHHFYYLLVELFPVLPLQILICVECQIFYVIYGDDLCVVYGRRLDHFVKDRSHVTTSSSDVKNFATGNQEVFQLLQEITVVPWG